MKAKKLTLFFVICLICGFFYPSSMMAVGEIDNSNVLVSPSSSVAPSESFLKNNTRTTEVSVSRSPMSSVSRAASPYAGSSWDEIGPGDWEWSEPGNVGGPIGDATLPVVISILLLYIGFRTVSTSRRNKL